MSARAPFIPNGSRPASRAAHLQDKPQNPNNNGPFAPDLSNPLHPAPGTAANSLPTGEQGSQQSTKPDSAISANDNSTRPLNTASVLKTLKFKNASRKPSAESAPIRRPPTTDPTSMTQQGLQVQPHHRNQASSHIVAPVPRPPQPRPSSPAASTASVPGIFTPSMPQNMFRLPVLPSPTQDASSDTQFDNNNTHIPASSLGFSFSKPTSAISGSEQQQQYTSQLPSPPKSARSGGSHLFDLKSSSLDTTDFERPPPFSLNPSGMNQTGPRRVLNSDGIRELPIDQASDSNSTDARRMKHTNSASLKRPRSDAHDDKTDHTDSGNDYGAHSKRYRSRGDPYSQHPKSTTASPSSPLVTPNPPHNRGPTPDGVMVPQDARPYRYLPQRHRLESSLTPPPGNQRLQHRDHQQQPDHFMPGPGSRPLDRLLGCSVDEFIEEHAEQYERAVERWKNCTMEEWIAGADEQVARFQKVFDFAKEHVLSKMRLFASFDGEITKQNGVLAEREKMLEGVKDQLIKESGNVLGGGSGGRY